MSNDDINISESVLSVETNFPYFTFMLTKIQDFGHVNVPSSHILVCHLFRDFDIIR